MQWNMMFSSIGLTLIVHTTRKLDLLPIKKNNIFTESGTTQTDLMRQFFDDFRTSSREFIPYTFCNDGLY
jgi:hypothetical protein